MGSTGPRRSTDADNHRGFHEHEGGKVLTAERIDHIGIAVKVLDRAVADYEAVLGLNCEGMEEVTGQKVKVAMLPVGETNIELLESTDPDGPVGKFIEKRGEGFHHIAFRVSDLTGELARLKEAGVRLIDEEPRIGAHGTKVAFIHPKSMGGVLVELVEKLDE